MTKFFRNDQSALTCLEFEDRVNELLDSRKDPGADESLIEHAKDCSDCELFASNYAIFNQLEVGPVEIIAAESKQGRTGAGRRLAVLSSVAAAMFVCGLMLAGGSQTGHSDPAVVMLAEVASPESERLVTELWEAGSTEKVSIASPGGREKMPASLQAGQAFASTKFAAVNWIDLEKNLESLQPVFGYSRRIPVVSSVQSTVDLTIGLIRAKKEQGEFPSMREKAAPDYGFLLDRFDNLA